MIVLFALCIAGVFMVLGLVIDAGNALAQRRAAQNDADFAALAAARVVGASIVGNATGTDANVKLAIDRAIAANGGLPVTYAGPDAPRYLTSAGLVLGTVGAGSIPSDTTAVVVSVARRWRPFIGVTGVTEFSASATATAQAGYLAGATGDAVLPIGVASTTFASFAFCPAHRTAEQCGPTTLTEGDLNVPGGFGWLKFGCFPDGGQNENDPGACSNSSTFLQLQIGPPSNSFGCCDPIPAETSIRVASLTGNVVSADLSYYINNDIIVILPIWDEARGNGSNAYYEVIGFAGFQITSVQGAKKITGVWRRPFMNGAVSQSAATPATPLAIRLIR